MKKKAIILLTILVLLIAVYASVNYYKVYIYNNKPDTGGSMLLHAYKTDDIVSVLVKNAGGDIDLYRGDEGEWEIRGFEALPYNTGMLSSYVEIISNVTAEKVVETGASDLGKYGLDTGTEATFRFKDGTAELFVVGDATPDAKSYYAKKEGSSTVYLINSGRGDTFRQSCNDLFVKEFLKEIDTSKVGEIQKIIFGGILRKQAIVIVQTGSGTGSDDAKKFMLEKPETYEINARLMNKIMNELTGIMRGEVVKIFPSAAEIEQYGLKDADYILQVDAGEYSSTLRIGKKNADGRRYIMREGVDILFAVEDDKISWVSSDEQNFYSDYFIWRDFSGLQTLSVGQAGTAMEYRIDSTGADTVVLAGTDTVDAVKFKAFYQSLMQVTRLDAVADSEIARVRDQLPELEIALTYSGSAESRISFIRLDEWLYLVKLNGTGRFSVTSQSVARIIGEYNGLK